MARYSMNTWCKTVQKNRNFAALVLLILVGFPIVLLQISPNLISGNHKYGSGSIKFDFSSSQKSHLSRPKRSNISNKTEYLPLKYQSCFDDLCVNKTCLLPGNISFIIHYVLGVDSSTYFASFCNSPTNNYEKTITIYNIRKYTEELMSMVTNARCNTNWEEYQLLMKIHRNLHKKVNASSLHSIIPFYPYTYNHYSYCIMFIKQIGNVIGLNELHGLFRLSPNRLNAANTVDI
eukprot:356560_1